MNFARLKEFINLYEDINQNETLKYVTDLENAIKKQFNIGVNSTKNQNGSYTIKIKNSFASSSEGSNPNVLTAKIFH